ncbi:COX15/CtaA family protein [Winogradskyella jejuensis]|uniref:Cytochrome c oxidase assembly protein subunit 15 n=1 Tax=Winogradskyella jejuensis TaxID=1089305 RepID=A0A1M5JXC2_9FLAO|nr:COX15/CtaA family protein [Winogradskyella jejuensis]SHG44673.1 cytochrome c oxidase assembly protein subunit 15 [Winogradskyella jejuensis]
MKKRFRKTVKVALVLIYLVIIAGAVVRMTGSGMGCPDWPKCFGYYIPPTDISELQFKPNHEYKKGIVIIVNEELQVAKKAFTSGNERNLENWEPYTAHDYAIFNPLHTWVEYINRLLGALSGLPILIFTIMSIWLWKDKKRFLLLSIFTVFAMAFQAWLGKTVVDSNLAPYKITIHMVMALVIVAVILYLIYASKTSFKDQKYDSKFRNALIVATILTLVQIVLGTQVRQFVDVQNKLAGYFNWDITELAPLEFYIHRSLSILVLVLNVWLFLRNRKLRLGYNKFKLVIVCIGLEIVTGIAMYYFNFPFSSQPLHLVIAAILIGIQFYIILESHNSKHLKSTISST